MTTTLNTRLAAGAILAALAALAPAASASAVTVLVDGQGRAAPQPYQRWVDQARVPAPPGRIDLRLTSCPDGPSWAAGCVLLATHEIFLGPDARTRDCLLHEVGHLFADRLTATDRVRFTGLIGRRGSWTDGPDAPAEQFAEAYSIAARYTRLRARYFGMYGYTPTPRVHALARALILRAAAR